MTEPKQDFSTFYAENRLFIRVLFWMVFSIVALFFLRLIHPILSTILSILAPFIIALVIAYVLFPVVRFLQVKLKLGRIAGILVMILIFLLVVGIFIGVLVPILIEQTQRVLQAVQHDLPAFFNRVTTNFLDEDLRSRIAEFVAKNFEAIRAKVQENMGSIGGALKPVAGGSVNAARDVIGGIFGVVGAIGGFFATAILVVVIAFYYLMEMEAIPRTIRRLVPPERRGRVWDLAVKSDQAVGGFLRGQLIACTGVAICASVGLYFIGLKQYAILIGCFAGMMNFIPYLGPIAGATPALLWALMSTSLESNNERLQAAGFVILVFFAVQMIDGFIFQPYIVGSQASLHPLAVMLGLAVGAQFGLAGMLVAVPLASIAKVLWVELYWSQLDEVDETREDREARRAAKKAEKAKRYPKPKSE